jgi:hypothetical protein
MINFRSIHGRLFLIFLFSMLGLLLIVSFVYYQRATDQIRDKMNVVAEKNISQTVGLFDVMLKGYDSVTKSLNSNNELMRLLRNPSSDQTVEGVNLERRITDILGAIFYSRNDIVGIHIVTNRGKVFSFDRSVGATVRDHSEQEWYTRLQQSTGEMIWLGVYPHSLLSGGIESPVFAFGRQLFELSALKSIGIVLIETDADAISDALRNASLGPGSNVVIQAADGVEIIRTNPVQSDMDRIPLGWPAQTRGSAAYGAGGRHDYGGGHCHGGLDGHRHYAQARFAVGTARDAAVPDVRRHRARLRRYLARDFRVALLLFSIQEADSTDEAGGAREFQRAGARAIVSGTERARQFL